MAQEEGVSPRSLFAGIFLVAFATLLLEVSFTRILSYTIWYHFAYVIISTALLGYGASGTLLAIRPSLGTRDVRSTLAIGTLGAALTSAGAIVFFGTVVLEPMWILRNAQEFATFIAYLVVATLPFFCSGLVVSLALREAAQRVHRLYFWDLLGAALGCAAAVPTMNALSPPGSAVIASAAFALSAVVFAARRSLGAAAVLASVLLAVASPLAGRLPFTPAASKALGRTFLGMVLRITHWSALFRTDIIERTRRRPDVACWEYGLSPEAQAPCDQTPFHIDHDGTAGTDVYDLRSGYEFEHFRSHVLRLPYVVASVRPKVLVIGVGGGRDVIVARQFGARQVTGVELDPNTIGVIHGELDYVTNGFFRQPAVQLIAAEGRHFVEATRETFDLIQLTGVDTLSAEFSGAYVLAENYLYTAEAMRAYLDRLNPGGILSFATGDSTPLEPRAAGRMVSTAQRELRRRGVSRPQDHIVVIDSGRLFVEIMIRERPFEEEQLARLAAESAGLGFRTLLLARQGGVEPYLSLISADGGVRQEALEKARYLLDAATDDRPFFFMFHRWGHLLKPGQLSPVHTSALGQIVLLALLLTLSLLGGLFVLGPLVFFRRRGVVGGGASVVGILGYFLAVGLGFMLFEISLIQKFVLFLGYPTYSMSVTLSSLLVFLGVGSFLSRGLVGRERTALPAAVMTLAALAAFYMEALPSIQDGLLGAPLPARVGVTVLSLLPLGLVMGMFFPLGIRRAAEIHEDLVPWAWAINGCASVTGAVLAVVLAMTYGIARVWVLSVCVYGLGVAALLVAPGRPVARA